MCMASHTPHRINVENKAILFTNRHEPLMLNIDKFGDAIRQLFWANHDLKKHLKKERKEIGEERGSLIQEIENSWEPIKF